MATERIGDMTLEELKAVIRETFIEELQEIEDTKEQRSIAEIVDSIRRHRWTPPPGSPTNLELLREDRDR